MNSYGGSARADSGNRSTGIDERAQISAATSALDSPAPAIARAWPGVTSTATVPLPITMFGLPR